MEHSGTFKSMKNNIYHMKTILLLTALLSMSSYVQAQNCSYLKNKIIIRARQHTISNQTRQYLHNLGVLSYEQLLKTEQSLSWKKSKPNQQSLKNNEAEIIRTEEPLLRTYILTLQKNNVSPIMCEKIYRSCGDIEWAEPYYLQQVQGEFIPNDSLINDQLMYKKLQAFEAWDIYKGDTNVIIGISDSGVLQSHEDYEKTLYINRKEIPGNSIDDDGNGYLDDWNGVNFAFRDDTTDPGNTKNTLNGHGTGTAGIASATVNNTKGCAGVGFNSRFVPMKTMPNNLNGIVYGYQSIMYAAQNGMKVVNLSWGGGPNSCVAQSVIDYAIANNLAVVAAAGNTGNSSPFYPAAYKGVLGVGVTEPNDTISDMSAFGSHLDIFAPGNQTWTTADEGNYIKFCCTSGAAPIISGAVALVRGKYPELTPEQALEHTRLSTDNIESYNAHKSKYRRMIPGRINLYKAISRNPFDLPSIRPESWTFTVGGKVKARIIENDTVALSVIVKNYLGKAQDLRFSLSTSEDTAEVVQILDSVTTRSTIEQNALLTIEGFRFLVKKSSNAPLFLRIDIHGKGETHSLYQDFFLLPCTPFEKHTTWSNNVISFSLADNARIGYAEPSSGTGGIGYRYKDYCNLLFEGGLMATEQSTKKVVNCVRTGFGYNNDFRSIKPFYGEKPNESINDDNNVVDSLRLGLEFTQKLLPPKDSESLVYIETIAKNISGRDLNDVAMGYFLDIDIGTYADSNTVNLLPEAVPSWLQHAAGAMVIERVGDYPHVGILSFSFDKTATIQSAGLNNVSTYDGAGFTREYKIQTLNSGTTMMWNGVGDVSAVSGIKFNGTWKNGETREMVTVFGAEMSRGKLAEQLRKFTDTTITASGTNSAPLLSIFPNPAGDMLTMDMRSSPTVANVVVYSLLGTRVIERTMNIAHLSRYTLSLRELAEGMYMVVVSTKYGSATAPLIISR